LDLEPAFSIASSPVGRSWFPYHLPSRGLHAAARQRSTDPVRRPGPGSYWDHLLPQPFQNRREFFAAKEWARESGSSPLSARPFSPARFNQ